MHITDKLMAAMIDYEAGCPRRINHFLKVHSFARTIGHMENLDDETQNVLEIAAILHDCGIRASIEKYGKYDNKSQEIEGPDVSESILRRFNVDEGIIERVKFLIAHHHTYHVTDDLDYQILIEADFLVNIYSHKNSEAQIKAIDQNIFKTQIGKQFLQNMFLEDKDWQQA